MRKITRYAEIGAAVTMVAVAAHTFVAGGLTLTTCVLGGTAMAVGLMASLAEEAEEGKR